MTQPLQSPDIATPPRVLNHNPDGGLGRLILAFFVGWYFFCEKLCHPIDDPITLAPFILIFGAFATVFAMGLVALLGLPIQRVPKIRAWWRSRWWPPVAAITAAPLLFGLAWLPGLRASIEAMPTFYVDSYNRPLGNSSWLLLLFGIMNYTRRRKVIPAPSTPPDGPITFEEAS